MNRKRYLLDAAATCIFVAIIILASCTMIRRTETAQSQGGYPGPTAYPAPATNTPAATAAPTRTPVPPGTPVCSTCQPTAVTIAVASVAPVRMPVWIPLFAAAFLVWMRLRRW